MKRILTNDMLFLSNNKVLSLNNDVTLHKPSVKLNTCMILSYPMFVWRPNFAGVHLKISPPRTDYPLTKLQVSLQ